MKPLELARAVAEVGHAVRGGGLVPVEAVLPVRLGEQQAPARDECAARGGEDEVASRRVVKGLVDQACVEAAAEVELLHVCDLEADVEAFLIGELAGDRDHVRRDVVALGADPVARREARHPAGAAAELDHRGARTEVE